MSIVSTVKEIVRPITDSEGLELWDVEFKKEGHDYFLRIYIDKESGVGINDCENVSRKVDLLLDELDPIPHSYILEVSSAGLIRELKTDEHLKKFLNHNVEVRLFKAIDNQKKFNGTFVSFNSETITIDTVEYNRKDVSKIIIDLI